MTVLLRQSRPFTLFALLSALDFGVTWHMLRVAPEFFYEGNPIARWFLLGYGWNGLAVFKSAAVLTMTGACVAIGYHSPPIARRVLIFACCLVSLVLVYSVGLAVFVRHQEERRLAEMAAESQKAQQLDQFLRDVRDYQILTEELGKDLIARRRSLGDVIDRLARSPRARHEDWIQGLRKKFPGCSDRECLAATMICGLILDHNHDAEKRRLIQNQLEKEYEALFGQSLPAQVCTVRMLVVGVQELPR